jgi:hypothetical protein
VDLWDKGAGVTDWLSPGQKGSNQVEVNMVSSRELLCRTRVVDEWHPVSLARAFGLKIGAGVPGHWKVVDYGKPGICQARAMGRDDR